MPFQTMPRPFTSQAARWTGSVAQRRTFSISRKYSENTNHVRRSISSTNFKKYWRLAAGATGAVAAAAFVFAPSRQQMNQPNKLQSRNKNASEREEGTEQRGLRPNVVPARRDQDSRETTGSNTQKGNMVQQFPDSKGFQKKKITSEAGMKQGTADKAPAKGYQGVEDKVAASKAPGGQGTISGKQEGLSNTDTKHSIDLTNTSEKSQKGEGTPETSKSKGTVDSKRPLTA